MNGSSTASGCAVEQPARHKHLRRKEARPSELTAAALALFVEKGFAATRLDDVAALAGVSKGTLYLYFDSKEALFKAVIREGMVPVLERGEALLASETAEPVALLRGMLLDWWEQLSKTPIGGVQKLMMAEAGNFPEVAQYYQEAVIDRGQALVRTALRRGVEAGAFRPMDVEMAVSVVIAPLLHEVLWRHSFASRCAASTLDGRRFLECYFDLLLKGLCSSSGAREERP